MVIDVRDLYDNLKDYMNKEVTLQGWVRNHRKQKEFGFIDFSDGTCFKTLQIVYDEKTIPVKRDNDESIVEITDAPPSDYSYFIALDNFTRNSSKLIIKDSYVMVDFNSSYLNGYNTSSIRLLSYMEHYVKNNPLFFDYFSLNYLNIYNYNIYYRGAI